MVLTTWLACTSSVRPRQIVFMPARGTGDAELEDCEACTDAQSPFYIHPPPPQVLGRQLPADGGKRDGHMGLSCHQPEHSRLVGLRLRLSRRCGRPTLNLPTRTLTNPWTQLRDPTQGERTRAPIFWSNPCIPACSSAWAVRHKPSHSSTEPQPELNTIRKCALLQAMAISRNVCPPITFSRWPHPGQNLAREVKYMLIF